jgi:hypothetical protein
MRFTIERWVRALRIAHDSAEHLDGSGCIDMHQLAALAESVGEPPPQAPTPPPADEPIVTVVKEQRRTRR